jgi:hypothetical protein
MSKKPKKTEIETKPDNVHVLDLTRFKAKKLMTAQSESKKPAKVKRPRAEEPFIRLPYHRFIETYAKRRLSASALYVAIELDHLHFIAFGAHKNPVTLSNVTELGKLGMPRNTKARALRELRDAGLISFAQKGHEAFVVTLSWHPVL